MLLNIFIHPFSLALNSLHFLLLPFSLIHSIFLFPPVYFDFADNLSNEVRIVDHFANPPLVENCTQTSLTCQVTSSSGSDLSQIVVFWTFRGENVSKLADIETHMDSTRKEWRLILTCPTLDYSGSYTCNAHHSNHTSILSKKEAVVQVYGTLTLFSLFLCLFSSSPSLSLFSFFFSSVPYLFASLLLSHSMTRFLSLSNDYLLKAVFFKTFLTPLLSLSLSLLLCFSFFFSSIPLPQFYSDM